MKKLIILAASLLSVLYITYAFSGITVTGGSSATGDYLPLAGGTLTGEVLLDELALEFQETDTPGLTDCTNFSATGGGIFYDDSENKLKKCMEGALTDLDTSSATATADISDVTVTQTELEELALINDTTISEAQWAGLGASLTFGISVMAATDEAAFQALITSPWADADVADTLTIGAGSTIGAVASGTMTGYTTGAQPVDATLTDIADGTIVEALTFSGDMVNTANPWAANEMATGTVDAQGAVELATTAEAVTATAANRAVTPAGLAASYAAPPAAGYGSGTPRPVAATTLSAGTGGLTVDGTGAITATPSITITPSATPGFTGNDSDDAAGTFDIIGQSSGGGNAIIMTLMVEETGGANADYLEIDGVSETVDTLKKLVPVGGISALTPVTGTAAGFAAGFTGANLYGGTYVATTAGTADLPVMAVGMNFCIITGGDIAVVVDTNGADGYFMDGTTNVEGKNLTNKSSAGDIACFQYYDASDWLITTNGWTPEA